ncbi:MAG TPA: hypothetical protein EYM96_07270 [Rhodospirillales bacterium]|mgnify:CR=1 FL=1|nr:hypothetical protein [Dehalococcoidia bacterium]HIN75971.1 hypothetical protein [Rhodospirillales bacterium]
MDETSVASNEKPASAELLVVLIDKALRNGTKICPTGALHPMDGQHLMETIIQNLRNFSKLRIPRTETTFPQVTDINTKGYFPKTICYIAQIKQL